MQQSNFQNIFLPMFILNLYLLCPSASWVISASPHTAVQVEESFNVASERRD